MNNLFTIGAILYVIGIFIMWSGLCYEAGRESMTYKINRGIFPFDTRF